MINPTQLTREAGFEEGVVIELCYDGFASWVKIREIGREGISFGTCDAPAFPGYKHGYVPFELIQSIRPLIGPIAIWNFAPKWAEYCHINEYGANWFNFPESITIPEEDRSEWLMRPWWAK